MVEDFVSDDARHLKALLARDRVYYHIAVNANEVLRIEDTIFILPNQTMSAKSPHLGSGR